MKDNLNENTELPTNQFGNEIEIALSSVDIESCNEEKKELNRTYELEEQLMEIRQQLTQGRDDTEQQTDCI